jgi:hypothetical protein
MIRLILDLCAGTGAWSAPYRDAGYQVRTVDLPEDVRLMPHDDLPVHGILAAPPCTYFCRMRMCRGRPTDDQFLEGLSVVDACLRLVAMHRPQFWALENPQGYLRRWLGEPQLKFHPWQFGDPWTKYTWIWGSFTPPRARFASPRDGWIVRKANDRRGIARTASERAMTSPAFARAFFEANP